MAFFLARRPAWSGPTTNLTNRWSLDGEHVSLASQVVSADIGSITGALSVPTSFGNGSPCLSIDGYAFITMSGNPLPVGLTEHSVFLWAKATDLSFSAFPISTVFTAYQDSSNNVRMIVNPSGSGSWGVTITKGGVEAARISHDFTDTNWHHIGYTFSSAGVLTLYFNGVALSAGNGAGTWGAATGNFLGAADTGESGFKGALGDVVVYSKALTGAEVTTLYNAGGGSSGLIMGGRTVAAPVYSSTTPTYGINTDLGGHVPLVSGSAWNTRVDGLPLRSDSATLITACGFGNLKAEFGKGTYLTSRVGIPYRLIEKGTVAAVSMSLTSYPDACDPGPYPIPSDTPIESIEQEALGNYADRHAIVVEWDSVNNRFGDLWEMFRAFSPAETGDGSWHSFICKFNAAGGDMQRTEGLSSADAAGLPIWPGLIKYDEVMRAVQSGGRTADIGHAIRFTVDGSRTAWTYLHPAQHVAGGNSGGTPFGLRVRLRASFTAPSSWPDWMVVITNTMQRYGMLMADNGGPWYFGGVWDDRWNDKQLSFFPTTLNSSDFECPDTGASILSGSP